MMKAQTGNVACGRRSAPDLYDVGKLAGVSHQTVSRVLNGHPNVKPDTRRKVLDAISELGYRRNTAARALATKKSGTIGVLTPAHTMLGPTSTAVESAARDAGYFVSLAIVPAQDRRSLGSSFQHIMSQAVEGIVVIGPLDFAAEVMAEFADGGPPVVIAGGQALPRFHSVSLDQAAGANMVVSHLAQLGHRNILHLSGPPEWSDSRARMSGWQMSVESHGMPPPAVLHGDWTPESGYRAGVTLLGSGLPDAVFAANDGMALGLLRAFRQHGLSVPRDVSVVGFDDVAGSAFYDPPLTTVRQDFESLGALAIRKLLELISEGTSREPTNRKIKPKLIIRESSGEHWPMRQRGPTQHDAPERTPHVKQTRR